MVDMTAIAAVCMPNGFVIGADGLRQTTSKLKVTEEGQKIFGFTKDRITLAYAWCGNTVVWNEDDQNQVFFDFRTATDSAINDSLSASTLVDFSNSLCSSLQVRLNCSNWMNRGWVIDFPREQMARMLIVGYFGNKPFAASVEATQKAGTPIISAAPITPQKELKAFCGCKHVLMDDDLSQKPKEISDARNLVYEYIRRCADNPKCEGVGGKIHIALVTSDSFSWLDPPISTN